MFSVIGTRKSLQEREPYSGDKAEENTNPQNLDLYREARALVYKGCVSSVPRGLIHINYEYAAWIGNNAKCIPSQSREVAIELKCLFNFFLSLGRENDGKARVCSSRRLTGGICFLKIRAKVIWGEHLHDPTFYIHSEARCTGGLGLLDRLRRTQRNKKRNHRNNGCKIITMPLTGMEDVPLIEMSIENGNIVILSISGLKYTQVVVVKRVVQTLNAFIRKLGGDIAQLGRDFIIVVPEGTELAFPANIQNARPEKSTFNRRYEKGRREMQNGVRSNVERLTEEPQRESPHSDLEKALKDPIFGL